MTFDISLHEACVRVGGRAGVRYVITKFSQMDSLPNFLTHGAPLCARFARARSSAKNKIKRITITLNEKLATLKALDESILAAIDKGNLEP